MSNDIGVRVVCAAIRLESGRVILGSRHYDYWMLMQLNDGDKEVEQGFIDNKDHFLTRQDAWLVAEAAGQIIRRVGGDDGVLYSENLY